MWKSLTPQDFDQVFSLMTRSFPQEEYRPRQAQWALLSRPGYRLYGQLSAGRLLGFGAVWELGPITFLEHLAVEPDCRGGGLGAAMLTRLRQQYPQGICLEVELPDTELARRRIGFYRRNGFSLNAYPYTQPALAPGQAPVPLRIMTDRGPLTPAQFEQIRDLLYENVYCL